MAIHEYAQSGQIHKVTDRVFADVAARDAATYDSTDVDKIVRVDSPLAYYLITAVALGVPTFQSMIATEVTTASQGNLINSATAKTTPVDADMLGIMDSAASNVLKKLSWLNTKATLKTYFDTLYRATGTAINDALTGFTSGAGTVTAADSILQALQKIVGNLANYALLSGATFTGAVIFSDQTVSRANVKDSALVVLAKGAVSGTVTFDYTAGSVQSATFSAGAVTWAFSDWPPTGNQGFLQVDANNAGLATITFPTVYWKKKDDTYTTTWATYLTDRGGETALKTSGYDAFMFWTNDAGTTVYGSLL